MYFKITDINFTLGDSNLLDESKTDGTIKRTESQEFFANKRETFVFGTKRKQLNIKTTFAYPSTSYLFYVITSALFHYI
jgi:hypothetical protein